MIKIPQVLLQNWPIIVISVGSTLFVVGLILLIVKVKRVRWFVRELAMLYSNKDSFFSKKRIESGAAFIIAEFGMVHWLLQIAPSDTTAYSAWTGIQFLVAGYTVTQIQKEKKMNLDSGNVEETETVTKTTH
jgi:hypothetical protein